MSSEDRRAALLEGHRRLYPSLANPHFLVQRSRRMLFSKWLRCPEVRPLQVLDVGGRVQPCRPLVEDRLERYVAIDPQISGLVDVCAIGEQIPFRDEVFDLVFCTQVLEYVPEPSRVVDEIYRVLKPGGIFLLSVPAVFPRDGDRECWRFLPGGLKFLLARFSHVEIVPEGYTVAGFLRTINACMSIFARYDALRSVLSFTLYPALNVLGLLLDRFSVRNDQFSAGYSALAQK